MQAQLTIRLHEELDRGISEAAKVMKRKRSDIVRMALERFIEEMSLSPGRPYDRVKKLVGSVHTGVKDLGSNHRSHLMKRFRGA